jgi:hypothetical protein
LGKIVFFWAKLGFIGQNWVLLFKIVH